MPTKSVVSKNETSAPDFKTNKSCITAMDAVYIAAEACATVKDNTLAKAWYKLLPSDECITAPEEPPNNQFVSDVAGLIKESSGFEECDKENIQDWLECDVNDPGYQVLTDNEIIASVINDQDPCDNKEEPSSDHTEKGPSSEEAFHCLETVMKWFAQQEECDAVQLLSLKCLRDLAAKKLVSALKQKKILDFFF
ncbi:hypothetical protein PR048_012877 [Dryococelus australis]|uniref:Uncharacterized protein n=1 Tax=Dryococelus australis TaxID=614101 RepID=A0ABQ9HQL3_9NEOP|nr:hypothetical protein PR048_012877 [Dryococelus australis]